MCPPNCEKQIDHAAITITVGTVTSQKGRHHHVVKTMLIGDLTNALKTRHLQIAHNLPQRDRLMQELESFEVKTTAAGNQILNARATEHPADLAIAAAIALYHSNVDAGFTGEGRLLNWF